MTSGKIRVRISQYVFNIGHDSIKCAWFGAHGDLVGLIRGRVDRHLDIADSQ